MVPGAGHAVQLERPDVVAAAIGAMPPFEPADVVAAASGMRRPFELRGVVAAAVAGDAPAV